MVCPQCNTELKPGDPAGLCPRCLLAAAIGSGFPSGESDTQTTTATLGEPAERDNFGPYRILKTLGEGGMGTVYLAEQTEPIRRRVALKVVKLGMDTNQVLARFSHERQTLARMEHTNIGRILDAGASSRGRPFFVMDYIEGAFITTYCDRYQLTTAQRLELFLPVCRAIQHAHNKGIIHRDIKPSNVLVAVEDGKPVPKVIDFGIAKALDTGDAGNTLTLQFGQMVGTPEYASPEQADLVGGEISAATDVYSLGVLLYELLIGAVPFDGTFLRKAGFAEMLRIIREEEPPSLVQRLSSLGPDTKEIAARRRTDAVVLRKLLAGDLNWIVKKALEKSPQRRYASPSELATDIERHLKGEPILAGPPRRAQRIRKPFAIAGAVLALFAAGYLYFHRPPKLTDKDTIVLADFVNNTGDPIFDGTLRQGLAIQLEQSPFLKIMDDEQAQRVLRLMSLPPDARITNQIAHEICVREGAAATIDGTIANLGKDYVITLQAITCPDGATLAREQIQAEDKEHVLNAVGTAATAMRGKLGESLNSIQKLNRPLEQATTPSLEALQNYTAGLSEMDRGQSLTAVPLFVRATTLDRNFAMAYFYIGTAYEVAGDVGRSREYVTKAFGLIDRVSEYERDLIAAAYYAKNGELAKAIEADQLSSRNYPREWGFHNALSVNYIDLGQYEEGLKEGLEATRLQANVEPPYRRQLDAYICLNRLSEAKQLAEKVRAQGLDGPRIHQRFLEMAYVEDDQAAADREIQWFAGKPEEYLSFGLQAANRNVHGQRRESSELYQRAAETALRQGLPDGAAELEEADARADALSGNCQTARRLGRPALALAMCGDAAQAEKLGAEISKRFPNGTIWNAVQLPEIRAAIALQRDQPAKAVELLASTSPYEGAYLDAIYLRGLAYLRLHKGAEAAAEFQKILSHKGANWASAWRYPYWGQFYSLSYLGMARGSALTGDTAKAKKAFQDFFELWKVADPDIPILKQAKAEFARL